MERYVYFAILPTHQQKTKLIMLSSTRKYILITISLLIPIGFATKYYSGAGSIWVNNYLGGIFYVAFFVLLVAIIKPDISKWLTVGSVVGVTCALETLQLWHPPLLEIMRSSFLGRSLLGNSFDWWDFPYYIIGGYVGYIIWSSASKLYSN